MSAGINWWLMNNHFDKYQLLCYNMFVPNICEHQWAGWLLVMHAKRRKVIINFLAEHGFVSVAELCQLISVSEMTIRRDLADMEKQGLVQRTRGGATITESAFFQISFKAKLTQFVEEKGRIGQAAAAMVRDGDVVILDSGSTTLQVAKHLKDKRITVVTNALSIASELLDCPQIEIHVAGGLLKKLPVNLIGPQTTNFFRKVRADKLFLGVEGVDVNGGLTVPDVLEAPVKQAMIGSAKQIIVVADHSKLGRNNLSTILPLAKADFLITGREAAAETVERLGEHIKVIVT
jgi:DeoR/GlpR family transcriptional regulator of sugar metabolism